MLGSFAQDGTRPNLMGESVLADGQDGLRGSDVVAGIPFAHLRNRLKILLDKVLSPRQSVSSAHDRRYRKLSPHVPSPNL